MKEEGEGMREGGERGREKRRGWIPLLNILSGATLLFNITFDHVFANVVVDDVTSILLNELQPLSCPLWICQ